MDGPDRRFKPPPFERIDYDGPGGCWIWMGSIDRDGYGYLAVNRVRVMAHRYTYTEFVGPIPAGHEIDHLCNVRPCVNPMHLEPVTKLENSLRAGMPWAITATMNACLRGHAYEPGSYSISRDGKRRHCRECQRIRRTKSKVRRAASTATGL